MVTLALKTANAARGAFAIVRICVAPVGLRELPATAIPIAAFPTYALLTTLANSAAYIGITVGLRLTAAPEAAHCALKTRAA
jgi:hypothetical protein